MIQAKLYFENELPTGGSKIPVGIHEGDVLFKGLVYDQGWWDLKFASKDGRFIHKRLFEPQAAFLQEGETPSDALERSIAKNVRIVVVALRSFLGDQAGNLEAPDYQTFMELAADTLSQFIDEEICLKVSVDPKNDKYGKVPDYNYMEKYVKGFPTSLRFTKKEQEKIEELANKDSLSADSKLLA